MTLSMQPHGGVNMQPVPFATSTAQTSAVAFEQVSAAALKTLGDQLFDLVLGAQRNGVKDMSLRELQQAYERRYSKRIELSSVSGAITRLVAAEKLVRDSSCPRPCTVTGRLIVAFSVPAKQGELL